MNFDLRHKLGCVLAAFCFVGYSFGIEAAAIVICSYAIGFILPFIDEKDKN